MLNIKFQLMKLRKPYGNLTVEDFTDSYKFYFFQYDYLKYKNFFEEGWFLFFKGKMKNKWNNPDEKEYKIDDIKRLSKSEG